MEFAHTSWRDVQLDHPADWELFRLIRKDDRWRCAFADRYHQRLDMRWRRLEFAPNLEKMLERHQKKEHREKTVALADQPEGWMGTVRQTDGGCVVNAGRFFDETGILVEVIVVWPGRRDVELENAILRSVRPVDVADGARLWEAMGIKAHLAAEYDIMEYRAEAGQVEWIFGRRKKSGLRVAIQRIAMPKYWLRTSLAEWLEMREEGWKVIDRWTRSVNGHEAAGLRGRARGLMVDTLLFKRKVKAEVAWLCDREQRVYRLSCGAVQRGDDVGIPEDVKVECCRR